MVEEQQVIAIFQLLMTKEELLVQEELAEQDMEAALHLIWHQLLVLLIKVAVAVVVLMVLHLRQEWVATVVQDLLLLMIQTVILVHQVFGI